jgi:hypothetical protein
VNISEIMSEEIQGDDFRDAFDEELNEKWVLFLDEQQSKVANEIYKDLEIPEEKIKIHYIFICTQKEYDILVLKMKPM